MFDHFCLLAGRELVGEEPGPALLCQVDVEVDGGVEDGQQVGDLGREVRLVSLALDSPD